MVTLRGSLALWFYRQYNQVSFCVVARAGPCDYILLLFLVAKHRANWEEMWGVTEGHIACLTS